MTANSLYRSIGSFSLPLSTSTADTATSLDPARDILLGLLAAALKDELAQRWTAVSTSGTTWFSGTTPVVSTCPDEPDPQVLQTTEHALPMLCVYREERGTWSEDDEALSWPFHIDYILGPMTVGDRRKMKDFLVAAAKVMLIVIEKGGHKAYATQSGRAWQPKLVLGPGSGCANLEKVKPTNIEMGPAGFSGTDTKYWALSLTVECEEGADYAEGDPLANDYEGVDATLGTGTQVADDPDEANAIIEDLVGIRTYALKDFDVLLNISSSLSLASDGRSMLLVVTGNTAAVTVTLPTDPELKQTVTVVDGDAHASVYTITIDGNGKLINGAATMAIVADSTSVTIVYNGVKWVVV